jgi:hypothetical protein
MQRLERRLDALEVRRGLSLRDPRDLSSLDLATELLEGLYTTPTARSEAAGLLSRLTADNACDLLEEVAILALRFIPLHEEGTSDANRP